MPFECPGSERFKQPKPEYLKCPSCGEEVEIWSDEAQATCHKCKARVSRKDSTSCLDWCKYAKKCIGTEKYNTYLKNKSITKNKKA